MNCIVTAGPTSEPLDRVRRLTNFSTGKLGVDLARFLHDHGHTVTLLAGESISYPGERRAAKILSFGSTTELHNLLQDLASQSVDALFHAAAVSDFSFGKIWQRSAQGSLTEIKAGKFSTRQGTLLAELIPTPKIIDSLRDWFPRARIVGWKYETDGDRDAVIAAAFKQLKECLTDGCVANGPAYGEGFGLVTMNGKCAHCADHAALYTAMEEKWLKVEG